MDLVFSLFDLVEVVKEHNSVLSAIVGACENISCDARRATIIIVFIAEEHAYWRILHSDRILDTLLFYLIILNLVCAIQVDIRLKNLRKLLLPEILIVGVEINLNFPLRQPLMLEV